MKEPSSTAQRNLRLAWWGVLGLFIAAIWLWAWIEQDSFRVFEAWLHRNWGADMRSPWWQRGDAVLHLVIAFAAATWVAWGRRIFHLRLPWWLGTALVLAVALIDEGFQTMSADRRGEWSDLAAGSLGAALGLIPGWWFRSRRVRERNS